MKYICKDFWTAVYKKQIDNLRTNHQGIYVLQDNNFQLLTQMSDGKQYTEDAPKFLLSLSGSGLRYEGALCNHGFLTMFS
ncbi:Trafficking protein particle complex subunit 6B [Desmophyllum pertusum]|uniref:Trafficking protein particle complex subunit 6B n=1 Tax=Desmophyllum pertusum TaxID=174260 RepID=A0A9W9ZHB7_9CNID|nr:Trafficking protein particle complex subunit 6B [Desmophyllum pertusum]